jgi:hypothetical protein
MEAKFNELMKLLNNSNKESQLRNLFNNSNNLEKINLLGTIQDFLGIKEKSILQLFKETVLNSNN